MSEYFDLELLKIRADVLKAAINSNIEEFHVRQNFNELMDDLREAWLSVSALNKESQ